MKLPRCSRFPLHGFVHGPQTSTITLIVNVEDRSIATSVCRNSCNENSSYRHRETRSTLVGIRYQGQETKRKATSMSDPGTISDFTIAPSVRETASEDGAVLLDVEQGICFSLNPIGLRIWELIKKRCSVDQIADSLAQDFSVPRAQLLSDAAEFIEALEAKRLIQRPGQTAPKRPWFARMLPRRKDKEKVLFGK